MIAKIFYGAPIYTPMKTAPWRKRSSFPAGK